MPQNIISLNKEMMFYDYKEVPWRVWRNRREPIWRWNQDGINGAAEILAEYSVDQKVNARANLIAWMDEALAAFDDERLQRITDSIEKIICSRTRANVAPNGVGA